MSKSKRHKKFIRNTIIKITISILGIIIILIGIYFVKNFNGNLESNELTSDVMANASNMNLVNRNDLLNVSRITGENPEEMAINMSKQVWNNSDVAIIVNQNYFKEGCISLPLSGKYNAPILLSQGETLNDSLKEEITRLKATKIILIGDANLISNNIENELIEKGLEVNRIEGKDITSLSISIAKEFKDNNTCILANSDNPKEMMLLSYIAMRDKTPLIISDNYLLTYKFLKDKKDSTIYFTGDENILYRTFSDLNIKKIDISQYFKDVNLNLLNKNKSLYKDEQVIMASSNNPLEFISAGSASGALGIPLIDIGSDILNKSTEEFMIENGKNIKNVIAIGNEKEISDDLLNVNYWGKFYTNAKQPLITPTYDGSNQAVHPDVLYVENGWNGYKYIMGLTPYPQGNDDYENPQILVSNDGINFNYLEVMKNPLDVPNDVKSGGHYSDINICLVDDTLEVYFRYNPSAKGGKKADNSTNMVYVMKSKDGINWSEKELVLTTNTFDKKYDYVSPIIIYDGGLYKIWFSNYSSDLYYTETKDWKSFEKVQVCKFKDKPANFHLWHHDLIKTDLGYEMVINGYEDSNSAKQNLYYTYSQDGVNFSPMKNILNVSDKEGSFDNGTLYKSSLVRIKNKYSLYYSARSKTGQWRIGLAEEKK